MLGNTYSKPILNSRKKLISLLADSNILNINSDIDQIVNELNNIKEPNNKDLLSSARKVLRSSLNHKNIDTVLLKEWIRKFGIENQSKYSSKLYNEFSSNAKNVKEIKPLYDMILIKLMVE